MKRIFCCLPIIILIVFFITACTKEETFPPTPALTFISLTKKANSGTIDDKGVLTVFFTDGDGDFGLDDGDTNAPFDKNSIYHYNYFIKYFEKQHGNFVEVNLPMTFNSRIPRLTPTGNNKAIKGEIDLEIFINNYASNFDTIRFEASVCDRALNMSNVITTSELVIKKH